MAFWAGQMALRMALLAPCWPPKLAKMTQKTPKVIIMAVVLERVMWIGGEI